MSDAMPDHNSAKLRRTVAAFEGQRFAVLDGARFDDLPKLCRRERLFARSLFLDHADVEVEKAGPWLIGLGQAPDATDKVLALVGEEPAAVFWCCDGGEAVLYRHLRTLNMVRIPAWAARGQPMSSTYYDIVDPEPPVTVLFRHWDPRVLVALMPVLDMAQFARVLGPASEIAFSTISRGGVRRIVTDASWPPAPAGLLLVRADQVEALTEHRLRMSCRRISSYLRSVAPEKTDAMSDEDLSSFVEDTRLSGVRLGLESEQAFGRWSYMMLVTDRKVLNSREICSYLKYGFDHPDEQISSLMESAARSSIDREVNR